MPVHTAVEILVLILLVLNLALSGGIVRRMRMTADPDHAAHAAHSASAPTRPQPGFVVELARDPSPWEDPAAGDLVRGAVLAAFVAPGCLGCERLHHELADYGPLPVPLDVIMDPYMYRTSLGQSYLQSWTGARTKLVAPSPLDILDSFGRPDEFPTLVLLQDGMVVASGHRLHDVTSQLPAAPVGALNEA